VDDCVKAGTIAAAIEEANANRVGHATGEKRTGRDTKIGPQGLRGASATGSRNSDGS
jgi:hypothetical protein